MIVLRERDGGGGAIGGGKEGGSGGGGRGGGGFGEGGGGLVGGAKGDDIPATRLHSNALSSLV